MGGGGGGGGRKDMIVSLRPERHGCSSRTDGTWEVLVGLVGYGRYYCD